MRLLKGNNFIHIGMHDLNQLHSIQWVTLQKKVWQWFPNTGRDPDMGRDLVF